VLLTNSRYVLLTNSRYVLLTISRYVLLTKVIRVMKFRRKRRQDLKSLREKAKCIPVFDEKT
jgi:hypothetical protein